MDKKKILVVDDSRTALFMVTTILRKERYELVTACDGEQALEMAASERPDLIVMDVIMPRKDTKAIPVILVTTRGEGENVEAGFQSGCNDYVTKPINAQELLTKVRDHMGAR